jgi:serine protease AprX
MYFFCRAMQSTQTIQCPLCNDAVEKLLYRFHVDSERRIIDRIKEDHPGWAEQDGACGRCVDYYHTEMVMEQRILPGIGPHFSIKSADDFIILPTGIRLNANPGFTGKGVTICFIDSGFYPHPDLVAYRNRIKLIIDVTADKNNPELTQVSSTGGDVEGAGSLWHGTMTTVVCAGDGYLCNGLYKGIASDAELVLIKVQDEAGSITTANIVKALQWVLKNHAPYNIKIVNMSLGGEEASPFRQSEIDLLCEELVASGISIVAAAGNDEHGAIKPPANALNVIAVGGIDDENQLDGKYKAYHSSYGKTADDLMKPELVAHAIWIAAPVLPCTKEQQESVTLYGLVNTPDDQLLNRLQENIHHINNRGSFTNVQDINTIRQAIVQRIQACKYIAPHYMHVDGTSFAAPIVTAVIAQMLEEDPALTPAMIREVLFSTASRSEDIPAARQGYGVIQPRKALLKIIKREVIMKPHESPYVNKRKKSIEFYIHNNCAQQISLAGNFNHWAQDVLLMQPGKNGLWKIEIPMLPGGKYHYKFFIDDKVWMEDVDNPYREPDGLTGFNSILVIEN